MGNPLYIRETLDQLGEENVLKAHRQTCRDVSCISFGDTMVPTIE